MSDYHYERKPWRNDQWYTSFWNFDPRAREMCHFADEIQIHDVTLRDGEQQSRVALTKEQKIAIAEKLDEVGVTGLRPACRRSPGMTARPSGRCSGGI